MRPTVAYLCLFIFASPAVADESSPDAVEPAEQSPEEAPAAPAAADEAPIGPQSDSDLLVGPGGAKDPSWQRQYEGARTLMEDGDFAAAADVFAKLAVTADWVVDRNLALQNAEICRLWVSRGAVLRFEGSDGEVSLARRRSRRTTGELATLYLASVGYGLMSGVTLATYTDPNSAAEGILPALSLAAASAGTVYLLDRSDGLGYGVPQSITSGLALGFLEGVTWTLWHFASVDSEDEWSEETIFTIIWGAGTLGAVLGGLAGDRLGTSPGRAAFLESSARWTGGVAGLIAAGLAPSDEKVGDFGLLAGALGLTAGAVGGYFVGAIDSPSVARTRFIDLGGISGALVAGGLYLSFANEDVDGQVLALTTAGGIAAGIGVAYTLTRDMRPDPALSRDASEPTTSAMVTPSLDGEGMVIGLGGTLR